MVKRGTRTGFWHATGMCMVVLVLLLHAAGLWWAHGLWQPRSQIQLMTEPMYARLIEKREPAALPRPRQGVQTTGSQPRAPVSNTDSMATRPLPRISPLVTPVSSALIDPAQARPNPAQKTKPEPQKPTTPKVIIPAVPVAHKPLFSALGANDIAPDPERAEEIEPFPDSSPSRQPSPEIQSSPSLAPTVVQMAERPASAPAESGTAVASPSPEARPSGGTAASAANGGLNSPGSSDVYQDWPDDTRINVKISGYYRGKVTGSGSVTWQREQGKYQARVAVSFGLGGFTMTSQGEVTEQGLIPRVFEENVAGSLRSAHFAEDAITIGSGKRIPRTGLPGGIGAGSFQDSASQFVELSWRFATGRAILAPGSTVTPAAR